MSFSRLSFLPKLFYHLDFDDSITIPLRFYGNLPPFRHLCGIKITGTDRF